MKNRTKSIFTGLTVASFLALASPASAVSLGYDESTKTKSHTNSQFEMVDFEAGAKDKEKDKKEGSCGEGSCGS